MEKEREGTSSRRSLVWPPEAMEIARSQAHPLEMCERLIRLTKHDKKACWRFLKRQGVENPKITRRNHYIWPEDFLRAASKSLNAAALCGELMQLTGYGERACWQFLERQGIRRPGSPRRKRFSEQFIERIVEYSTEHGMQPSSLRFNIPLKVLYNLFYRQEMTCRSRDFFTLREVCCHLAVRAKIVHEWVEAGFLIAEVTKTSDGRVLYAFSHDTLTRFCKQNRELLLRRRWPEKRLEFIRDYIFAPKHADLLDSRECKRAREAQVQQEQQARSEHKSAQSFDTKSPLSAVSPKIGRTVNEVRNRNNGHAIDDCALPGEEYEPREPQQ